MRPGSCSRPLRRMSVAVGGPGRECCGGRRLWHVLVIGGCHDRLIVLCRRVRRCRGGGRGVPRAATGAHARARTTRSSSRAGSPGAPPTTATGPVMSIPGCWRRGFASCRCAGMRPTRSLGGAVASHSTTRAAYPVLSNTATWVVLSEVNGLRVQSAHRSRSRSPASRAIRSSSDGHTYRYGAVCRTRRPSTSIQ